MVVDDADTRDLTREVCCPECSKRRFAQLSLPATDHTEEVAGRTQGKAGCKDG